MDLRRGRGGRAWSEEEVARLETRKARRRWQELRPGAQSSKLDLGSEYPTSLCCRMAMDLKERAEVMAKQEEAMRVSFNLERKVTESAKTESSFNYFLLLMFSGSFCDRLPLSRLLLAKLGTSLNLRPSPSSTSGRTCEGTFFKFSIF